ncbi:MAG: hypothetical protein HYY00_03975 [Chloroflexi bacterium]|nr:hypothetical protein [Chloroflexota bacterium]
MNTDIHAYLGNMGRHLRLEPGRRSEILRELSTHVEERVRELRESGIPSAEATESAIRELGDLSQVSREMYSVHSTGSWSEVLLATTPHLLLAAVFALHLWTRMFWVVALAVFAGLVAVLAWRRGNPKWSYPWLGYALAAPAVTWLLALASLAYGAWQSVQGGSLPLGLPLYLGIAVYIPFSLWVMMRIARRVARQDWLLASLAALPLPFLGSWLFFLQWRQGLLIANPTRALAADADTALMFVALAVTTALFLKIGRREWRILLVIVAAPVLAALGGITYQADPQSLPIIVVTFLTVAFLLSPLLLGSHDSLEEVWYAPSSEQPV